VKYLKIAYCNLCDKEVKPVKKPMNTLEKVLWFLVIVASLGIALIIYLIYRFRIVKKKFCPTCATQVHFKDQKEIEEKTQKFDTSTAKGKILEKVEKAKTTPKTQKIKVENFCPYCGSKIPPDAKICPSCKTSLK